MKQLAKQLRRRRELCDHCALHALWRLNAAEWDALAGLLEARVEVLQREPTSRPRR